MTELAIITIIAIAAAAGGIIGWIAAGTALRDQPADDCHSHKPR